MRFKIFTQLYNDNTLYFIWKIRFIPEFNKRKKKEKKKDALASNTLEVPETKHVYI